MKSPLHGDCYQMLGKVLPRRRRSLQRPITNRAYILDPNSVKSQTNLAEILSRAKAFDKAEPLYQVALAHAPDDPQIKMNYAIHLFANGPFEKGGH